MDLLTFISIGLVVVAVACIISKALKHKSHHKQNEIELFMIEAKSAMEEYHKKYGIYAKDWSQLDIAFVNGPYKLSEPGIRPEIGCGNKWQPKRCNYIYEIVKANGDEFAIRAVNARGVAEYEIEQNTPNPLWIG